MRQSGGITFYYNRQLEDDSLAITPYTVTISVDLEDDEETPVIITDSTGRQLFPSE